MTKELKTPLIPPAILPFVQKPPILRGESLQAYNDLLAELVDAIGPVDFLEWLWLLEFLNSIWEALRWRRYKAALLDLGKGPALKALLLQLDDQNQYQMTKVVERYSSNPRLFKKHGLDPAVVPAKATIKIIGSLEALGKMVEQAERRCDTILQQLEYRREVFTHRARRAAEKVLGPRTEEIPRIAPPEQHTATNQSAVETGATMPAPSLIPLVPTAPESSIDSSSTPSSEPKS